MDNEVDPVDELIKKTGCMEFHEKVQVSDSFKELVFNYGLLL